MYPSHGPPSTNDSKDSDNYKPPVNLGEGSQKKWKVNTSKGVDPNEVWVYALCTAVLPFVLSQVNDDNNWRFRDFLILSSVSKLLFNYPHLQQWREGLRMSLPKDDDHEDFFVGRVCWECGKVTAPLYCCQWCIDCAVSQGWLLEVRIFEGYVPDRILTKVNIDNRQFYETRDVANVNDHKDCTMDQLVEEMEEGLGRPFDKSEKIRVPKKDSRCSWTDEQLFDGCSMEFAETHGMILIQGRYPELEGLGLEEVYLEGNGCYSFRSICKNPKALHFVKKRWNQLARAVGASQMFDVPRGKWAGQLLSVDDEELSAN